MTVWTWLRVNSVHLCASTVVVCCHPLHTGYPQGGEAQEAQGQEGGRQVAAQWRESTQDAPAQAAAEAGVPSEGAHPWVPFSPLPTAQGCPHNLLALSPPSHTQG